MWLARLRSAQLCTSKRAHPLIRPTAAFLRGRTQPHCRRLPGPDTDDTESRRRDASGSSSDYVVRRAGAEWPRVVRVLSVLRASPNHGRIIAYRDSRTRARELQAAPVVRKTRQFQEQAPQRDPVEPSLMLEELHRQSCSLWACPRQRGRHCLSRSPRVRLLCSCERDLSCQRALRRATLRADN